MEKAKRRVRICLLCVVLTAVAMGILYYFTGYQEEAVQNQGTLVELIELGSVDAWV